MMALAAKQPPTPIAQLVPGVPRDLAHIVDRALAQRPEDRYPHAGALAGELKDFLTGQLVASRHYTRRERFVRFLRLHRVAAFAVTAAVIALAVVGSISASRVLAERANTKAALATALHEKRQADEALVQVTLNQARALLATDPTAAVAVARPLASSARWREVRAIAAAARGSGACVGLPGPLVPMSIVMAPGGRAAASVGLDGTIWYLDLANRTSREVINLGGRGAKAAFSGDHRLVVFDTRRLAVVDLASGAIRELRPGFELRGASATAAAAFVVAASGKLYRFELDGSGATELPPAGVLDVAPSPDGRTLAVETGAGLVLLDPAGAAPPVKLGDQLVFDVRWDAASQLLSARLGEEVVLVALRPAPEIVARRAAVGLVPHHPRDGRLIVLTTMGLEVVGGGSLYPRSASIELPISLTRGNTVVIGRRAGLVTLVHEDLFVELRAPTDELLRLAASPASPYIVGATRGRILVWDSDAMLPAAVPIQTAEHLYTVDGHRVLIGSGSGPWRWRDLDTGHETPFELPPGLYRSIHDGHGDALVLLEDGHPTARGFLIARYGERPGRVDIAASVIAVHDGVILAGTADGEVIEIDPAAHTRTPLVARRPAAAPVKVTSLGALGAWRAARWADGRVWRRGPDGREATGVLAAGAKAETLLLVTSAGRACATAGPRIECWNTDGSSATVATMSFDIDWAELPADDHAIVALADRGVYRIDLATGAATSIAASGGSSPSLARAPGLAVVRRADNRISVIDMEANAAWPLSASFFGGTSFAQITSDGALVSVIARMERLLTWRLELPQTPEATARWLDQITNATAEQGTMKLGWR
jgi:hypothetical protein